MHVYHAFPKWKYHAEKEARIVPHKEAEAALGEGWFDSPAHAKEAAEKAESAKPKSAPIPTPITNQVRRGKA